MLDPLGLVQTVAGRASFKTDHKAMISIREEIRQIENGTLPQDDNPLKNAPHTAESLLAGEWTHPYTREAAAYPVAALRSNKYWSPVGRVDNVYGDRNLFCSCVPVSELA